MIENFCLYCGTEVTYDDNPVVVNCTIDNIAGQIGTFCSQECANAYGNEVGEVLGVHYTGDVNPLLYGGAWYEVDRWNIAEVVRAVDVGIDGLCWIETGSLDLDYERHNSAKTDFIRALECSGYSLDEWEALRDKDLAQATRVQVDSLLGYWGLSGADNTFFVVDRNNYTKEALLQVGASWRYPRIDAQATVKLWKEFDGDLDKMVREWLLA